MWATALYAGLRLGELKALRVDDIDLDGGLISVERSWDVKEGPIEPRAGAAGGGSRSPRPSARTWPSTSSAQVAATAWSSGGQQRFRLPT